MDSTPKYDEEAEPLKNDLKEIYPSVFDEPFYFESDSLALKGNLDYSCLLKVLVLLEAQRVRACQDLEGLIDMKERALKDPAKFIGYLNKKHSDKSHSDDEFKLPNRQSIYALPKVEWNKYYDYIDISSEDLIKNENLMQSFHSLRRAKRSTVLNGSSVSHHATTPTTRQLKQNPSEKNYNKSWGVEEQRTLEELLIEFPPEDNEAARWRKIATKLGTRTPLQVQSHCQKYFIKLAKAGLPVPGRMPNLKTYVTKKGSRGGRKGPVSAMSRGAGGIMHSGANHHRRMIGRGSTLNEISSMWSSFNPPIKMDDDQEEMDDENSGDYYYDEENSSVNNEQQFEDGDEYENDEECEYNDEDGESQTESYENDNNGYQFQYISPKKEPIFADESDFYNNNNKS